MPCGYRRKQSLGIIAFSLKLWRLTAPTAAWSLQPESKWNRNFPDRELAIAVIDGTGIWGSFQDHFVIRIW